MKGKKGKSVYNCNCTTFGIQASGGGDLETRFSKITQIILQQRYPDPVLNLEPNPQTWYKIGVWHLENIIDEVESDWLEPWFLSTAYIEYIPFLEAPAGDVNFLCHFSS